ncbi:MAG: hypothetical protein CMJ33_09370 [Phycisphaerae bacterium]|nr:hypothetical protein [Phycisphaerae bacterium]
MNVLVESKRAFARSMTGALRGRRRGAHVVRVGSTSGHVTAFVLATIVSSHDFESLRERRTISGVPVGIADGHVPGRRSPSP